MALTYLQRWPLIDNPELLQRVRYALLVTAEAQRQLGVAATPTAQQWWRGILLSGSGSIQADGEQVLRWALVNPTFIAVDGVVTDAQIQTFVNSWVTTIRCPATT